MDKSDDALQVLKYCQPCNMPDSSVKQKRGQETKCQHSASHWMRISSHEFISSLSMLSRGRVRERRVSKGDVGRLSSMMIFVGRVRGVSARRSNDSIQGREEAWMRF